MSVKKILITFFSAAEKTEAKVKPKPFLMMPTMEPPLKETSFEVWMNDKSMIIQAVEIRPANPRILLAQDRLVRLDEADNIMEIVDLLELFKA